MLVRNELVLLRGARKVKFTLLGQIKFRSLAEQTGLHGSFWRIHTAGKVC